MKPVLRLPAVAGLALALIASGSSVATAGPSTTSPDDPIVINFETQEGQPVATTGALVTDYWTPERMAAAAPLAGPTVTGAAGERAAAGAEAQTNTAGAEAHTNTAGKIFFTLANGVDSYCSSSVVDSPKKRLVLTAAHCVYMSGVGGASENIVFVPGWQDGDEPLGKFGVTTVTISPHWPDHASNDYSKDFAVLTTANGDLWPNPVGSVVAPFAVQWDPGYDHEDVVLIGYPQDVNGGATQHHYEKSPTSKGYPFGVDGAAMVQLDESTSGGASGGPYVKNFDGVGGTIVSVHSLGGGAAAYGPYLGEEFKDAFDWAEGWSPE